jgi:hypothetical protein
MPTALLRRLPGLLTCGIAVLLSRPATGSGVLEMLGAPTGSNGLSARALSHGAAATYFNPALLPDATPKLEAGFFGLAARSRIRLQARPAGVDVPASVYDTITDQQQRPRATADLPQARSDTDENDNTVYAVLGVVRPLAGRWLAFGFYAVLPVNTFMDQRGFFPDEREQYFSNRLHSELMGDRLRSSSFAVALGSQLNDWLAVGAGIDIAIVTRSTMAVYLPDTLHQEAILLNADIRADSKFKPYFAAAAHPSERTTVFATIHTGINNETQGFNSIRYWNFNAYPAGKDYVPQVYVLSQGYEPTRFGTGATLTGPRGTDGRLPWELGLQLVFERWSTYHDRHGESPADTWHDTLSIVAGGNLPWGQRRLSFDLGWVPSPVPDQTGRTNYVDNSRVAATAGIESPIQMLGHEVEAGFYLFGSFFIPRDVTKRADASNPVVDEFPDTAVDVRTNLPAAGTAGLQTNNPGYPGFSSRGYMVGAGVSLRIAR